MLSLPDFNRIARSLFAPDEYPRWLVKLDALERADRGEDIQQLSKALRLPKLAAMAEGDFDTRAKIDQAKLQDARTLQRVRQGLGQLLIGRLAEHVFERIYHEELPNRELQLEDDRANRSDTDYRVLNGQRRPIFRMNIKFHGATFRKAADLVGLPPEDCFPLATYKIRHAVEKQDEEHLPYIFVVVGVRDLTGVIVSEAIPQELLDFLAIVKASALIDRRQDIEDRIVDRLTDSEAMPSVANRLREYEQSLSQAEWRILSARKAESLVLSLLFQRVYAVRVRGFAQNYRNAEVDMHFSIAGELTPLRTFLSMYRDQGLQMVVARLAHGTI